MSNDQALVQVNIKSGEGFDATLVNVYAKTPDELVQLLEAVKEHAPLIAEARGAVAIAHGIEVKKGSVNTVVEQGQGTQQAGGWGGQQQGQAAPSWSGGGGGGSTIVEDKWNNKWEYDCADAPLTPRGPAVLKHGKSREGKDYKKWEDPAAGPRWFSERKPKVETSDRWQGSFVNNR